MGQACRGCSGLEFACSGAAAAAALPATQDCCGAFLCGGVVTVERGSSAEALRDSLLRQQQQLLLLLFGCSSSSDGSRCCRQSMAGPCLHLNAALGPLIPLFKRLLLLCHVSAACVWNECKGMHPWCCMFSGLATGASSFVTAAAATSAHVGPRSGVCLGWCGAQAGDFS